MPPDGPPRVHVVIPTHTTRHLDACLSCFALQTLPPATVVVSCDTDAPEIGALLRGVWPRVAGVIRARGLAPPVLLHTFRPSQGGAMLNQVRNNGLRALERGPSGVDGGTDHRRAGGRWHVGDAEPVILLDGDTVLARDAVARHAALAAEGYELIIPFRVNLDEAKTARVTAESILAIAREPGSGTIAALAGAVDEVAMASRERRYRRQLLLRKLVPGWAGVPKRHKPKILGGHHAVSVRCLRAVNGYDEEYRGYGFDDDDLSRRLYELPRPPRTAIAVRDILAFHLWHPSRAPGRPTEAPGFARFRREDLPMRAEHGWQDPLAQAPVTTEEVAG